MYERLHPTLANWNDLGSNQSSDAQYQLGISSNTRNMELRGLDWLSPDTLTRPLDRMFGAGLRGGGRSHASFPLVGPPGWPPGSMGPYVRTVL